MNVGDVVQLKSGGPHMTITTVNTDQVICIWFEKGKQEYSDFNPLVLEKIENDVCDVYG